MNIICCDVDGTLTDFERFVLKYGVIFLKKFYNLTDLEIDYEGYDLDEVFINQKLEEYFKKMYGISKEEVLNKFWNIFYPLYISQKLKPGASQFFRKLTEDSELFITTSRKKSTSKSLLGLFVRKTIIAQLRLNFIPYNKVLFFEDDDSKMEYIKRINPILVFDDKPTIINELMNDGLRVICQDASYNRNCDFDTLRISGYGQEELVKTMKFRRM